MQLNQQSDQDADADANANGGDAEANGGDALSAAVGGDGTGTHQVTQTLMVQAVVTHNQMMD